MLFDKNNSCALSVGLQKVKSLMFGLSEDEQSRKCLKTLKIYTQTDETILMTSETQIQLWRARFSLMH